MDSYAGCCPGRTRPGAATDQSVIKGGRMGRRAQGIVRSYKHQLSISFTDELYGGLMDYASRADLPLNFSVRELVQRGLEAEARRLTGQEDGSLLRQLKT